MKALFIFCSICCFVAIASWPIGYYTFLRLAVSLGSIAAIYYFVFEKSYRLVVFLSLILILFNPIIPIHLYKKSLWIPLDIITGLLFSLLAVFLNKKQKKIIKNPTVKASHSNSFTRDRIMSPKKPNL